MDLGQKLFNRATYSVWFLCVVRHCFCIEHVNVRFKEQKSRIWKFCPR